MNRRTARRRYSLAVELYRIAWDEYLTATDPLRQRAASSRVLRHLATMNRIEAHFTR